ncbi:hypothetical protein GGF42_007743 [Coemansia sp. RSA 2424]|nr:hypothetical protein GGF42_007743 [Coemansia sp. RSA 2424]
MDSAAEPGAGLARKYRIIQNGSFLAKANIPSTSPNRPKQSAPFATGAAVAFSLGLNTHDAPAGETCHESAIAVAGGSCVVSPGLVGRSNDRNCWRQ